jgi:hypothetical protein
VSLVPWVRYGLRTCSAAFAAGETSAIETASLSIALTCSCRKSSAATLCRLPRRSRKHSYETTTGARMSVMTQLSTATESRLGFLSRPSTSLCDRIRATRGEVLHVRSDPRPKWACRRAPAKGALLERWLAQCGTTVTHYTRSPATAYSQRSDDACVHWRVYWIVLTSPTYAGTKNL